MAAAIAVAAIIVTLILALEIRRMSAQVDALAAQVVATQLAITNAIAALAAAGTDPATIADLTAKLKVATDALTAATPAA